MLHIYASKIDGLDNVCSLLLRYNISATMQTSRFAQNVDDRRLNMANVAYYTFCYTRSCASATFKMIMAIKALGLSV